MSRPWRSDARRLAPLVLLASFAGASACGTDTRTDRAADKAGDAPSQPDGSTPGDSGPDGRVSGSEGDGGLGGDDRKTDGATPDGALPGAEGGAAEPEGGSPGDAPSGSDDGGPDAPDASIEVQGSPAGQPCMQNDDCASGLCVGDVCTDATSCLALLGANPGVPNREYEIDPDGAGKGLAPFVAYCDMTTDGGGWTTLPLRFADPAYWSITQAGEDCVKIDIKDNGGNFRQYQSSNNDAFAYTYVQFVPPIPATAVRFVNFNYTNGGTMNTMDFEIGMLPVPTFTSYEGWYFADPSALQTPVGYAFPDVASCTPPYDVEHDTTCSRDSLTNQNMAPTAPFFMNATIPLSSTTASFAMGLIEGCPSYPLGAPGVGEQFYVQTAPADDGIWITGISVR